MHLDLLNIIFFSLKQLTINIFSDYLIAFYANTNLHL